MKINHLSALITSKALLRIKQTKANVENQKKEIKIVNSNTDLYSSQVIIIIIFIYLSQILKHKNNKNFSSNKIFSEI